MLVAIAPHISKTLLPVALQLARLIQEGPARAQALAALLPRLEAPLHETVGHEILIAATSSTKSLAERLPQVAPYLSPGLLLVAVEQLVVAVDPANTQDSHAIRHAASCVKYIAQRLPCELLPEIQKRLLSVASVEFRTEALIQLAPFLSPSTPLEALDSVSIFDVSRPINLLLRAVTPEAHHNLLEKLCRQVLSLDQLDIRARRLVELIELIDMLSPELRQDVYQSAIEAACATDDALTRNTIISRLAEQVPQFEAQPIFYGRLLDATRTIHDEQSIGAALAAFAPHLPSTLLPEVGEIARGLHSAAARATVLTALVPHLSARDSSIAQEALASVDQIRDHWRAVELLTSLAPWLEQKDILRVYSAALRFPERARVRIVAAIAPYLPAHLIQEALDYLQAIDDWIFEWDKTVATLILRLTQEVLDLALGSMVKLHGQKRPGLLSRLMQYAPMNVQERITQLSCAEEDESARADNIAAIAPYLYGAMREQVLAATRMIVSPAERARALGSLLPLFSEERLALSRELLATVHDAIDASDEHDIEALIPALESIVRYSGKPELYSEAFGCTRIIVDKVGLFIAEKLAPMFFTAANQSSGDQSRAFFQEAFNYVRAIDEPITFVTLLDEVVSQIPADLQPELLEIALAFDGRLRDYDPRADILDALIPTLPENLLPIALEAARAVSPHERQGMALAAIAKRLGPVQPDLYAEALRACCANDDDEFRDPGLRILAEDLACHVDLPIGTSLQCKALRSLTSRGRPDLLEDIAALVPWLAAGTRPELITEMVRSIADITHCWR